MPTLSLASLLVEETKATLYAKALQIAQAVGLNVSSWQPGDPTRSLYNLESEVLATLESVVANFIRSGFLDYATGTWLKILAKQVFNVDVPDATFATTSVTLTNAGGGVYDVDAGDLTFKSTTTGKTYRNTTGGHLSGSGGTLSVTVVADEPGSGSSAGAGEIDALVTTLLGVSCTNAVAAVGIDEQPEDTTRQQCRDKLGPLSPKGPKEAYSFVAREPALGGVAGLRVRVYSSSDSGYVTVYLADASGGVSEPVRAQVEAAILKWSTPLCVTPTVLSASNVSQAVTYRLWVYNSVNKTSAQVQADVQTGLEKLFSTRPIGGDAVSASTLGALNVSAIAAAIENVYPQIFRVDVVTPASNVSLGNGQVATLGAVSGTITFAGDP